MELHERIYDLRKKAGLSQEELSEQVGVSRQAVGKWEQGQALPDIENLIRLSRVLGVTVDELLGTERSDTPAEGVLSATEVEALLKEQELRAQKREQEREQKARLRDKVDEDMAHLRRNRRFAVTGDVTALAMVVPKSTNGDTAVRFTAENRETGENVAATAAQNGGKYAAEFTLPCGTYEIFAVIESGGVSTSESLGNFAANPIGLEARYMLNWAEGEKYEEAILPEGAGIKYRPSGILIITCENGQNPARKLSSVTVTLYKNGEAVDEIEVSGQWLESYTTPKNIVGSSASASEFFAPEDGYLFVGEYDFGEQAVQNADEFRISVTAVDAIGLEYYQEDLEVRNFTTIGSGGHRSSGHLSLNYELYA